MFKKISVLFVFMVISATVTFAIDAGITGGNVNVNVNGPIRPIGPEITRPDFSNFGNSNLNINTRNTVLLDHAGKVYQHGSVVGDLNSMYTSEYNIKHPKNGNVTPEKYLKNKDKTKIDGKTAAGKEYKETLNSGLITQDGINFTSSSPVQKEIKETKEITQETAQENKEEPIAEQKQENTEEVSPETKPE